LRVNAELVSVLLRAVDAMKRMAPTAASVEGMSKAPDDLMRELADWKTRAQHQPAPANPVVRSATDPARAAQPANAEAAQPQDGGAQTEGPRAHTLRVDIERLDQILTLVGEIAIARGRLSGSLEEAARLCGPQPLELHRESDRLFLDLQDIVLKIRMVPLGPTCRQYTRTVRDLADSHGKKARLVVEGGEVEVDMSVVEHLRDPLTHIVRNAISHAIEPPAVRREKGKDPCGVVTIRARRDASSIVLQVADDGAGMDRQRLLETARSRGLLTATDSPRDEDILRLIFEPGFSTASEVGDLSGRGIGMDIVRRNLEALRGSVEVESTLGQGTIFTLRIPLTLAIIPGFSICAGEETYILPMDTVVECLDVPPDLRVGPDGLGVLALRGRPLPCLKLRTFFAVQAPAPRRESVVVVRSGELRAGIIVDVLEGEIQAVIKPLGRHMGELLGMAGSTILGSGRVAMILDVPAILRHAIAAAGAP